MAALQPSWAGGGSASLQTAWPGGGATLQPLAPRIAHTISGGVRGFPDPTMSSWLHAFAQNLSNTSTPDVFMYMISGLNGSLASHDVKTTKSSVYTPAQLRTAIALFRPVAVVVEESELPLSSHLTSRCKATSGRGPVCATGDELACQFYSQFDKVARAFELVRKHEVAHSFRYDWVTRLRPDVYFEPIPPSLLTHMRYAPSAVSRLRIPMVDQSLLGNDVYELTDEFALVPRQHADAYFSARDAVDLCAPLSALWRVAPETWLPEEYQGDRVEAFFDMITNDSSTWPGVSGNIHPEIVLTYWVRKAHGLPLPPPWELTKTTLVKVTADGQRESSLSMWG